LDPSQIVHLFANPWTAVVGVLAAVVETVPEGWVHRAVRRWIGWLAVLACAPVALVLGLDVAGALLSAAMGLAGSWLLVEAVEAGQRRVSSGPPPHPPPPPPDPKRAG
jgi:hypothetical protein